MLTKFKIKALIYQFLVQSQVLIDWFSNNYAGEDVVDYISEYGAMINIDEMKYPAIRYRVASDLPSDTCEVKDVLFDIYIESRKDITDEADELTDVVREIFNEDEGRALGVFSESVAYKNAVGEGNEVRVWEIEEINNDQVLPEVQRIGQRRVLQETGYYVFNTLRYQTNIADN